MKRIISIVTATVIILSMAACNNKDEGVDKKSDKDWRIVSLYNMIEPEKNGTFTLDSHSYLSFMDFSTMEEIPLCDDPTCKHDDDKCSAEGKYNHPFLYDNKLYYFETTDLYQNGDGYTQDSQLWQCDINGDNEKQIAEFKGLTYWDFSRLLLYGDTIYMCMDNRPFDKDYKEAEPSMEFVSYNLKSGEIKNYGVIVKGDSCASWLFGMWDGKIIFSVSRAKENLPFMEKLERYAKENGLKEDEAFETFVDEYIEEYLQFDILSGEISECTLPATVGISNKYYYYSENDNLMYLDTDGKEHKIDGVSKIESINVLNDYVSFNDDSATYLYNESEHQLIKLNDFYEIITVHDENNVIFSVINDDGTSSFKKKTISELEKK